MSLADRIIDFNRHLSLRVKLPKDVSVMNPYRDSYTLEISNQFYRKYYNDNNPRTLILGINPGRFGAGTTGVPFTDPIRLEKICGINNTLPRKPELSSEFIYHVIESFGGPERFYSKFLFGAVCPLGFIRNGKNLNYYDLKDIKKSVTDFCATSILAQLRLGQNSDICFCLGEGQNYNYLESLNTKMKLFRKIVPLPHPRFIMQYRRKRLEEFITLYIKTLDSLPE